MKNIKAAFPAIVMMLGSICTHAQKTMSEGAIVYTLTIHKAGADSSASSISDTATVTEYIKGGLSRTDMRSSFGSEATIHDAKSGNAVILKEYSGQKLMITLTKENWDARNKKFDGIIFKQEDGDTVKINGYRCIKAIAQLTDVSVINVYYTTDINVLNKEYNNMFKNLLGIPVKYDISDGKYTYSYSLSKIDLTPVTSAKFDFPKSGYRVMTYEESEQYKK
jgi:GLPGLI family protein